MHQVKDEQFDFLYASLRARSEQFAQSKLFEEQALRARVEQLEITIHEKNTEKNMLRIQLHDAQRRLNQLSHSGALKCWFNAMPDEIMYRIMSFTDSRALGNLSGANKYFYASAGVDFLWIHRFRHCWGKGRLNRARKEGRPWKQIYIEHHETNENWKRQKATVLECKGHSGTVTCLSLCKSKFVSGSDDGSLVMWDLSAATSGYEKSVDSPLSPRLLPPPALPLAQVPQLNVLAIYLPTAINLLLASLFSMLSEACGK